MASAVEPLLNEIKETFGRVAYTHKTHEKQAEIDEIRSSRIKFVNVIVIGITAAAALVAPLIASAAAAWVAVAAAVVALVFATFQLSFDPAADAARQRLAAKSYLAMRNEYRRLLADADANDLAAEAIRARRDLLARELDNLDRAAPQTSPKAYGIARLALRGSEDLTFSDQEYRHLLPSEEP